MRSYHCNECNTCIRRMDHHCAWLLNCIGYGNYKSFYFFIMYLWTTALFICWHLRKVVYVSVMNSYYPKYLTTIGFVVFIACLAIGGLCLYYNIFHTWLILKAFTTTEYYEFYHANHNNPTSIYSISFCHNIKIVFGATLIEWLLPCSIIIIRPQKITH